MTTFTDVLGTTHVVNDEVLGLFGATANGGTESGEQSAGTPGAASTIVMMGSDNGFLVRRYGPNDYRLAYADDYAPGTNPRSSAPNGPGAHVYRSLQIEQLSWILNSEKWIALCEDEFSGGKYAGFLNSLDSGKTWQRSDGGGAPGDPPPMDNSALAIGLNIETSPVDEDGRIWDMFTSVASPPSRGWYTSSDYGLTWIERFLDVGAGGGRTHWVSDGYIWAVQTLLSHSAGPGPPAVLRRISTTTGATVNFSFAWPSGLAESSNWAILSNYASHRLFIWPWSPAGQTHYLNVDITDPDNPDGTWVEYSTISGYSPGTNIIGFAPVTNQKCVMVANNITFGGDTGAAFYSSDGGLTWTKTIDYTPDLSYIADNGAFGVFEETPRLSTDGRNVFLAAVPPNCYLSDDYGATWTMETMDMSIFDGYSGIAPTHWLSTAIAGPGGNIPFPPSTASRGRIWGLVIG